MFWCKWGDNKVSKTYKVLIHGFRDSRPVRKLLACCLDMQNFRAKQAVLVAVFKAKAVHIRF